MALVVNKEKFRNLLYSAKVKEFDSFFLPLWRQTKKKWKERTKRHDTLSYKPYGFASEQQTTGDDNEPLPIRLMSNRIQAKHMHTHTNIHVYCVCESVCVVFLCRRIVFVSLHVYSVR